MRDYLKKFKKPIYGAYSVLQRFNMSKLIMNDDMLEYCVDVCAVDKKEIETTLQPFLAEMKTLVPKELKKRQAVLVPKLETLFLTCPTSEFKRGSISNGILCLIIEEPINWVDAKKVMDKAATLAEEAGSQKSLGLLCAALTVGTQIFGLDSFRAMNSCYDELIAELCSSMDACWNDERPLDWLPPVESAEPFTAVDNAKEVTRCRTFIMSTLHRLTVFARDHWEQDYGRALYRDMIFNNVFGTFCRYAIDYYDVNATKGPKHWKHRSDIFPAMSSPDLFYSPNLVPFLLKWCEQLDEECMIFLHSVRTPVNQMAMITEQYNSLEKRVKEAIKSTGETPSVRLLLEAINLGRDKYATMTAERKAMRWTPRASRLQCDWLKDKKHSQKQAATPTASAASTCDWSR